MRQRNEREREDQGDGRDTEERHAVPYPASVHVAIPLRHVERSFPGLDVSHGRCPALLVGRYFSSLGPDRFHAARHMRRRQC